MCSQSVIRSFRRNLILNNLKLLSQKIPFLDQSNSRSWYWTDSNVSNRRYGADRRIQVQQKNLFFLFVLMKNVLMQICFKPSRSKLCQVKLKELNLWRKSLLLNNLKFCHWIFLLDQQKIILIDRFNSCPAEEKVVLMYRLMSKRRNFSCSWLRWELFWCRCFKLSRIKLLTRLWWG